MMLNSPKMVLFSLSSFYIKCSVIPLLAHPEWGMKVLMSCATECSAVSWASGSIAGNADSFHAIQIICSSYSSMNISRHPGRKEPLFLDSFAAAGIAEPLIENSLQELGPAEVGGAAGRRQAGHDAQTKRSHVSIRQPVTPRLEETSVDLSVSNSGSIAVTFNQLFKVFAAGGQAPAADSMEQFALLHLITPGSIAQ